MRRYYAVPRLLYHFFSLRKNTRIERSKLDAIQEKKVKALLKFAYENVRFYHKLFDQNNIKPTEINSLNDLKRIPIVTRKVLQQDFAALLSVSINPERCSSHTTSGSSGVPLTVLIDNYGLDFRSAVSLRQFFECGGRLQDKQLQLRAAASSTLQKSKRKQFYENLGLLRMESVRLKEISEGLINFLKRYKPDVMISNPSTFQLLCERLDGGVNPRIVFCTGEILSPHCRASINKVLGATVIDSYGCTEAWDISWQCPEEQKGYHINADSVLVEFVKNGENVAPGEEGEIVLTNLFNYAMPFIRYNIGDVGVPSDDKCPCGRTLPLMSLIKGRSGDFIVLPNGKKLSPAFFDQSVFNEVLEYRIVQKRLDLIEVLLKTRKGDKKSTLRCLRMLKEAVGDKVEIITRVVDEIPRDDSGKLRRIISKCVHTD